MPTLTNWNDEVQFDVPNDQFKKPEQISDVQAIVKQAFEQDQHVTVIGAMHSTTACMAGTGIVISMEKMDSILSVDKNGLTATVQAGVSFRQLCSHLKELGLQPSVLLEWGNFRIGAISGTQANDTSMKRSAQFSSYVQGVKLVTPTGEVMEISETTNSQNLAAIRSHNGLFGVVCEVTLRILETRPLQVNFQVTNVDSFLDDFTEQVKGLKSDNDQVFGMLFPTTGELLFQRRKFVEPGTPHGWLDPIESKGISLYGGLFLPLVKALTALRPSAAVAQLLHAALIHFPLKIIRHTSYIMDPCDRGIIWSEDDPNFEFYDWAFPEEKWPDIMRAYLQLSQRFQRERNYIQPLPCAIYFIKQDESSLLSRSRTANMMTVDPEYPDPTDPTWREFRFAFNEIAVLYGGIPHINKTRDGAINHLAKAIDPDVIRQYLELRKQFDPKDLFLNDYFKTMFSGFL
ncbi:FAD-binding domain-containing protein [Westerdykella ornata]|uniref:D-arabinono-1,4-lactone oxidase n=1 Tax=Westerdykella ornata TaxID=318751 RepID=A0A6A6JWP4_WESOR|nr:FAD-binding domain-containing protein [Westerdykella ornata]KAF2280238.1 FAD-binding domain-containing protein [Westerdykella ornata]